MEPRHDDFDWTLLDRYAAHEATAEEAARVESWIAGDPARRALLEAMRRPAAAAHEWDVAAAWAAVRARTITEHTQDPAAHHAAAPASAASRAARRWALPPVLLRAAAFVVVVGAAAIATRALLQRDGASAELIAVTTVRSESDTVRLDDGSVIILAAQSSLEYPRSFNATSRAVRLTGEALFRVAPDSSRPFSVQAGHALIRVVGTEFVTRTGRADASDPGAVTVAVAEGIVAVRAADDSEDVMVRRGEVARTTPGARTTVNAVADLDRYLGWLDGRLVFDDTPLTDVLAELRRWYPLDFRAEGTLSDRRVTARLHAGSLDETVQALALALGATHRRTNDTITFTPHSTAR